MSSKQDLNGARSVQDLERKYNFASLLGLKKNIEIQAKSLNKLNNELNNILNSLIINLKNVLNSQSEVSLWFYSGIPTIDNKPYILWESPEEHYGDIYYDKDSGYVYQFYENGWERNEDYNLVQAMALTNTELDTSIDFERKVFLSKPIPPYSSGDWWIKEDGTLFICQLGKVASLEYEENDFIISSKYTTTVAIKQNDEITVLKGTVTQITEDYVKFTDLSTGGSTTIAGENITTGVIKSQNYASGERGMKIDLSNGTIDTKNTKWDEYGNIKLNNGAEIITDKGLMTNLQFQALGYQNGVSNNVGWNFVGFSVDYLNERNTKDFIEFLADIPENFTITKAYVTLLHQPVYYTNIPSYGYSRALGLYKALNDSHIQAEMNSGFIETISSSTEIINAFGSNDGWTPSIPSYSTANIETIKSIDISNQLISGSLNRLIIQTKNNPPEYSAILDSSECAKQTGRLKAVLNVYGFMNL